MFNRDKNYKCGENNNDRFYLGIFIGVILGAGLYWLIKSDSGKKFRKLIMKSEEEWAQKAKELISEADIDNLLDDEEEVVISSPRKQTFPTGQTFIKNLTNLPKRRFFRIKR